MVELWSFCLQQFNSDHSKTNSNLFFFRKFDNLFLINIRVDRTVEYQK